MSSTIGERIRAVRIRSGLSQDRFARSLGFTRRSLLNWEGALAEPPIAVLAPLRTLYDVDPEWVVMGEDDIPQSAYGSVDWERYDRLMQMAHKLCDEVGLELEPQVLTRAVRGMFDDGPEADKDNRKELRRVLLRIAKGKL